MCFELLSWSDSSLLPKCFKYQNGAWMSGEHENKWDRRCGSGRIECSSPAFPSSFWDVGLAQSFLRCQQLCHWQRQTCLAPGHLLPMCWQLTDPLEPAQLTKPPKTKLFIYMWIFQQVSSALEPVRGGSTVSFRGASFRLTAVLWNNHLSWLLPLNRGFALDQWAPFDCL